MYKVQDYDTTFFTLNATHLVKCHNPPIFSSACTQSSEWRVMHLTIDRNFCSVHEEVNSIMLYTPCNPRNYARVCTTWL